jgi:hypothetical protein
VKSDVEAHTLRHGKTRIPRCFPKRLGEKKPAQRRGLSGC